MADQPENSEKVYLLVYSTASFGTRDEIKACLDKLPQIIKWRTDLPTSFYLTSAIETANELSEIIVKCMGKRGRFILTELSSNVQGWLPSDAWHFLKRKTKAEADAEKLS